MGQSSANRDEPTMEDILSSIRRIIQTNEEQSNEQPISAEEVYGSEVDDEDTMTLDAGASPGQPAYGRANEDNLNARHSSDDSVGDDVSMEARNVAQERNVDTQPDAALHDSLGAMGATQEGELVDPPTRDALSVNSDRSIPKAPTIEENMGDDGSHSLAVDIDITDTQSTSKIAEPPVEPHVEQQSERTTDASAPNFVAPLISADSSARIASSFADLSNALAAQSATNLEEITHDIVRPLVKEWLDNNLPSMVERMVRDEIERIARGG